MLANNNNNKNIETIINNFKIYRYRFILETNKKHRNTKIESVIRRLYIYIATVQISDVLSIGPVSYTHLDVYKRQPMEVVENIAGTVGVNSLSA